MAAEVESETQISIGQDPAYLGKYPAHRWYHIPHFYGSPESARIRISTVIQYTMKPAGDVVGGERSGIESALTSRCRISPVGR